MRVSIYSGEGSLSELTDKLFQLKGADASVRSRVEEAILRANPHLGILGNLPAGIPIVVPDIEGVEHVPEAHPVVTAVSALIGEIRQNVVESRTALDSAADHRIKDAQSVLKFARSPQFRTLIGRTKTTDTQAQQVVEKAKADVAEAETFKTFQTAALDQMGTDLAEMAQVMTRFSARTAPLKEAAPQAAAPSVDTLVAESKIEAPPRRGAAGKFTRKTAEKKKR